jgi:hypothetical protein
MNPDPWRAAHLPSWIVGANIVLRLGLLAARAVTRLAARRTMGRQRHDACVTPALDSQALGPPNRAGWLEMAEVEIYGPGTYTSRCTNHRISLTRQACSLAFGLQDARVCG